MDNVSCQCLRKTEVRHHIKNHCNEQYVSLCALALVNHTQTRRTRWKDPDGLMPSSGYEWHVQESEDLESILLVQPVTYITEI